MGKRRWYFPWPCFNRRRMRKQAASAGCPFLGPPCQLLPLCTYPWLGPHQEAQVTVWDREILLGRAAQQKNYLLKS